MSWYYYTRVGVVCPGTELYEGVCPWAKSCNCHILCWHAHQCHILQDTCVFYSFANLLQTSRSCLLFEMSEKVENDQITCFNSGLVFYSMFFFSWAAFPLRLSNSSCMLLYYFSRDGNRRVTHGMMCSKWPKIIILTQYSNSRITDILQDSLIMIHHDVCLTGEQNMPLKR